MCSCQNKISGMKRKRSKVGALSMGSIQDVAMNDVLPAAVGFIAGGLLQKNIQMMTDNPTIANVVKIAGGVVLASQGSGLLFRMGVGLAANGVYNAVAPQLNLPSISLLPPGQASVYLSGTPMSVLQEPVEVKMQ